MADLNDYHIVCSGSDDIVAFPSLKLGVLGYLKYPCMAFNTKYRT